MKNEQWWWVAGRPSKSVPIAFIDAHGRSFHRKSEFVATATGVEGSLVYGASSLMHDEIAAQSSATFQLETLPDPRMYYHSIP